MKPKAHHALPPLSALAPGHPDEATMCHTRSVRPQPARAVAESDLAKMQREYKQTGQSIAQMKAYLATL